MKKILDNFIKNLTMFILGCCFYTAIEMVYRGYSFRLMLLSGGVIFIIGSMLNNKFGWKLDLLIQCGIISATITLLEAVVGNIDYYFLKLNMWDYSNFGNFSSLNGKICLPFSIIWFLLGFPLILVADAIEYYWFHEGEQPEYWIFGKKVWQMPKRKCHM